MLHRRLRALIREQDPLKQGLKRGDDSKAPSKPSEIREQDPLKASLEVYLFILL